VANALFEEVNMGTKDFFDGVEHIPVSWRQYDLFLPVFYHDFSLMSVSILVSIDRARKLLPSQRLRPYRITPRHTALRVTAYQYRECDLGPYNEVSISVPVTIDQETPLFTGILRKIPDIPMSFTYHLPVTTEIAREVGAEFAGYPKFVADIGFEDEGDWLRCELRADSQRILVLRGRKLGLKLVPRLCFHPLTHKKGSIMRSEMVVSERELGSSTRAEDVELELGDHPISEEIRDLSPGRTLSYMYCPHAQGILSQVIESFPV
jgi:hypothetical protein